MNRAGWRAAAAAFALITVAAACGGDDGSSGPTAVATTAEPAGTTAAVDTTAAPGTTSDADPTTAPADATTAPETTAAEPGGVLGPEQPATGDPVKIGMVADGKTPATDNTVEFAAAKATVEFLNEHRGGLAGRPIELITCDAQLDPALTTDCANQMVQERVSAVVMGTQGSQELSWQVLHDAGIPMLWGATNLPAIIDDADTSFVMFNADAALIDLPLAVADDNGLDKVTVILVDVPAAKGTYEPTPAEFTDAGVDLEVIPVAIGTADMTAPLQSLAGVSDTVVHIVGYDAFCISAFNAMQALGFTGPVSANALCVTDATREAVAGEELEGVSIATGVATGVDDASTELYRAVVETYDSGIDHDQVAGATAFTMLAGLSAALEGSTSDLSPASVIDALRTMEWMELPGAGGVHFRCNGNAVPDHPALCVRGALEATLDDSGKPASYDVIGDTEIED